MIVGIYQDSPREKIHSQLNLSSSAETLWISGKCILFLDFQFWKIYAK